jgi:ribosomal protein S18 acetylase RimI-like enzyme
VRWCADVLTPATAADVPAIQRLLELDPDYFARVDQAPIRPDEGAQTFAERPPTCALEQKHLFVMRSADGSGAIDAIIDLLEGYPEPHIWYLGLIFLAPAVRGAGLGTRLLDEAYAIVTARGGRALRLAVASTNPDARRLYERLGFQHVARRPRTGWNGAVIDCAVMERALYSS